MVSGIERLNIRRRTIQGRRDKARGGQVIACHFNVYGYRFVRKFDDMGRRISVEMVIEESEAKIVRLIFTWYVDEGMTFYQIAKRLTEQQVPRPRTSRGDWPRSTISHILANETYTGVWHYGKRDIQQIDTLEKIKTQTRRRDKSEWIPVKVPAIIKPSVFKAAQGQRARRQFAFKPNAKHEYLLRGRLRCARCKLRMVGQTVSNHYKNGAKRYFYYRCQKNGGGLLYDHCPTGNVPVDKADVAVWDKIREWFRDRRLVLDKIETDRAQSEQATRLI